MKKEVYSDESGVWSWVVTAADASIISRTGYAAYATADEDADEEMRRQIQIAAEVEHRRRHQMATDALAALSPNARKALAKDVHLADAATIAELAQALQDGKFDYGNIKGSNLKSKGEIMRFVASRIIDFA